MQNLPIKYFIKEVSMNDILKFFNKEKIRKNCENCLSFNKVWSCPNYDFLEEDYLKNYNYVYVLGAKLFYNEIEDLVSKLKSSNKSNLDISISVYNDLRKITDEKILLLENKFKNTKSLLGGKCSYCEKCTRIENIPCAHPEKLRYSLESLGFDVTAITENILNEKIIFTKDALPEYCLSIYALLSKDKISETEIENIMK